MKIIKKLTEIPVNEKLFITIGNFDGVHFGHFKILEYVKEKCEKENGKFVVVTFIPHPLLILRPRNNYLLNTYEERRELLNKNDVDYILEIEFGRDFSNLEPELFLDNYILNSSHSKSLFLGHDFAFGAGKKGNYKFAADYCKGENVKTFLLPKFEFENENISSSIIRSLLFEGDMSKVNKLLRREYFIQGTVIKGKARGSSIGFPTANISYSHQRITPSRGVYITKTKIDDKVYHSVTNIGHNPTFEFSENLHVETHILGFDDKIYGKEISVYFYKKLREEVKFNSVNELVEQINKDIVLAKDFFKE